MEDYLAWLNSDRRIREMHFQLSLYFAKVRGKPCSLRVQGLTDLILFVKSLKEDDLKFFQRFQDVEDENICKMVFKEIVIPCNEGSLSVQSRQELYLGLELIQGVCLLHFPSKTVAADHDAVKLLLELLDKDYPQIQVASLECLLSILVDKEDLQRNFRDSKGIDKVTSVLRQKTAKKEVRLKCAEFLFFLIRYFSGGMNDNRKKVIDVLGDRLTQLLTQSVQLNPTKEKGEKFEGFIRELDKYTA
eukprot:TRINITY_DN1223_c0_g1_i1.p1 TRINITY_DN1223_c0_g1~~TRINITY_DN1223_c0_g1_i1.p1  ORF type:complete len:246 (+),score=33.25 TRINITY_DN1223_c0_g1_i1:59-796(+)